MDSKNQCHPDWFSSVSCSYEVLSSYQTRKRYDQGMAQKSYTNDYSSPSDEVADDPQTKFYQQHMRKDRPPPPTGSTPIYDFDEVNFLMSLTCVS